MTKQTALSGGEGLNLTRRKGSLQENHTSLPTTTQANLGFCNDLRLFFAHGDGWFRGLLASEKKRPCTESLLVLSRDGNEQAS